MLVYFAFRSVPGPKGTLEDVDFDNRLLNVKAKNGWVPKGNEERTIPMTDGAM
jgi:integrase